MAANVTVEVVHSRWSGTDGDTVVFDLGGGVHEVDLESHPAAANLVNGALAAGSLRLIEGTEQTFAGAEVESDEASLAFQAKVDELRAELLPERDAAITKRIDEARADIEA